MAKKLKVRTIVFGIRFKFSIVMISAVVLVSALIGFPLIYEHEKKIIDTLNLLGSTTLNGIADEARTYLNSKHRLLAPYKHPLTPGQKVWLSEAMKKSEKEMSRYFSSVVMKEPLLDIAFIIDISWKDIGVDWKRADQSLYQYFNRSSGALFMQGYGRKDPLLEPAILGHYLETVDVDTFLGFAEISSVAEQFRYLFEDKPDYVVVGIPLFNTNVAREAYKNFIDLKNRHISKETLQKYLAEKKYFRGLFTDNIMRHGLSLPYNFSIKTDLDKKRLLFFFSGKYNNASLNYARRAEFSKEFLSTIGNVITDNTVSLPRFQSWWQSLERKYGLKMKTAPVFTIWHDLYFFAKAYRLNPASNLSLDDLALYSYRKDLAGVLGLFLTRAQFSAEMVEHRNGIINMILSILIRAIFLAVLIPTFIIRSISTLADGAMEIGKGNLERTIDIDGTDEIGRLADILNMMTASLSKAQETKIEKMRMERELLTAQQIQAALLPEQLPRIKGMEFGAYYSAQTESGGDYYDFIELGGGLLGVAIADVSGHGVGSGLVMAMTRTLLHTHCASILNTKKILEKINDYLKENTASNYFVSMFYGILNLDTLTMAYSSAGHCQPLVIRDGAVSQLPAGGIALGVVSADLFSKMTDVKEVRFRKGDYFVQFTDGVDEATDSRGNEFGMERFHRSLAASKGKSASDIVASVVSDLDTFTGKITQHDDITMIIFRIK